MSGRQVLRPLQRLAPFLAVVMLLAGTLMVCQIHPLTVAGETATTGWMRQLGTSGDDSSRGISAVDGAVYVGEFTDNGSLLRKYDASGSETWSIDVYDSDLQLGGSIYASYACSSGIYVTTNGGYLLSGDCCRADLLKYSATGAHEWSSLAGDGEASFPEVVFADSSGIYVAGWIHTPTEGENGYLSKYYADGSAVWTREYTVASTYFPHGVSANSGYVYVGGAVSGTGESFVRRYDSAGSHLWTELAGFAPPVVINAVSADSSGVYVAGVAHDSSEAEGRQAFVRKYNSNGDRVWTSEFGSSGDDVASAIIVNSTGVYVAGYTEGVLPGQTGNGGADAFVRKYDTGGDEVWTYQFGSSADDSVTGISADATGIYAVGDTDGTMPGLMNHGGQDVFVMRITTVSSPSLPSVTTNTATSVTTTSAALNGNLTGMGATPSVNVSFQWGLSASYGTETTPVAKMGTGAFSANLTGLTPNTTYHFRAKAVGDGVTYGDDVTFITSSLNSPPMVTTNAATASASTSVTLNGDLAALGTAGTVNVSFEWGETPAYGTTTTPAAKAATGAFSANLTGLTPNTTYHFRAKAVGDGVTYGDDMSFHTPIDAPPSSSNCAALIVGVANYQYGSPYEGDLNYPDDDAQALYDILSPIWGESNVKLLMSAQATKAGIQSAISSWLDPLEDADDTVLFFYSGHGGYADFDQAPLDEIDGRDEVICPYDTSPYSWSYDIFDDELNTWLSDLESTRQVVIINSCYGGGFIGGDFGQDLSKSGRVVLTSGDEDESTWEDPALGHSVFPHFLLEAFEHLGVLDADGNNQISAEEFFTYAQPRTTEHESTHGFESIQHPQIFDGYGGELGLVTLATLTIDADPRVTSITLDGEVRPDLPVSVDFLPGSNHTFTFSVEATIDSGVQQPKYTFVSWDDGATSVTRTAYVDESTSYVANYRTQYYLTIDSDLDNLEGEGWYENGTEVSLSARGTPQESSGTRHAFSAWSVDGKQVAGNPITVEMDSAHTATAICTTQYKLTVLSDRGEVRGTGWYDAGSEASIFAESSSGSLVRYAFAAWSGDYSSTTTNATVVMSSPKTIEAIWRTDFSRVYALIAGVLIVAGVLTGLLVLRMKTRDSRSLPRYF